MVAEIGLFFIVGAFKGWRWVGHAAVATAFPYPTAISRRGGIHEVDFDCRVVGTEAQRVIAHAKKHVDGERKVLVAFKLGDLYPEPFTYEKGTKAGTTGVSLKARLLRIDWVRVDGRVVYTAPSSPNNGDTNDAESESAAA